MKTQWIFPSVLILLDICASIPYFVIGDWKRGAYWLAAAALTCFLTY
jgi:hypothetical protein